MDKPYSQADFSPTHILRLLKIGCIMVHHVIQDTQTKQDNTQLFNRKMLFQANHLNPMAGHLGQTATLNLSPSQLIDIQCLQQDIADVFLSLPGRTNLIQHHIKPNKMW